jgi:outer membrane lipoprotein-sorting protein
MNATVVSVLNRTLAAMAVSALLSIAALPARAADWSIDQLMRSLAVAKSGRATFIETKYIAMLDRPLVSTGILTFVAPDRLEKVTVNPEAESMRVDGDTLVIERKKQTMSLQLSDHPEVAGIVDSMRGTLSGDRDALERLYTLRLQGTSELWTLDLIPKDSRVAGLISAIRVTGNNGNVASIAITQADGDRSVMVVDRITTR